jgi:phosphonate transport system substrate-binding protein
VDQSYIGSDGELYVGDIKVLDARRNVRDTAPDIVDKVRILRLSAPVPNDTLSFGASFPEDARQQILDALFALAGNADAWNATALKTAYSWTGIVPVEDAAYDSVRDWFDVLGLSQEDFYK